MAKKQKKTKAKKTLKATKKVENKTFSSQKLPSAFWLMFQTLKLPRTIAKPVLLLLLTHLVLTVFILPEQFYGTNQFWMASILNIILGMMYVWLFRVTKSKMPRVGLRDTFFEGTVQFVSFSVLLLLSSFQLLPLAIGAWIFEIAISGGIAITFWQQVGFGALWFVLALPSMYWLSATVFGLVLVTIHGVRPLEAWRAGRKLVRGYVRAVVWRIGLFVAVLFAVVLGAVLAAASVERLVFAANIPTYSVPLLVYLMWRYVFLVYQELLSREID